MGCRSCDALYFPRAWEALQTNQVSDLRSSQQIQERTLFGVIVYMIQLPHYWLNFEILRGHRGLLVLGFTEYSQGLQYLEYSG